MEKFWNDDDLIFLPLGGSDEIGMNANLFHHDGRWLMVDLGISFPDETMPGIDVVLPDLKFIEQQQGKLDGLVITHGHEDHLGAIPYLWQRLRCPIYGTPFTLALVRGKLQEHLPDEKVDLISLPFNDPVTIGAFSVEMVSLTHSIPDPAGLVLRAGGKTIFHTGDWKFDPSPQVGPLSDMAALQKLGDSGVDIMIGDSTNAMVEGRTGSEEDAFHGLLEAISTKKGRVAVTCFASNLARVQSLINIAIQTNRSPVLVGRALHRITDAARSCGYTNDWPDLVSESDFDLIPKENILLICTGSQGEPRSALARIARGEHHNINLEKDDTVFFSSRQIPGNEVSISRVQDNLIRRGIEVVTDDDAPIHVSGHPGREEMAEMYQLIRPNVAIPVHGTARHLRAHAELATSCQVKTTVVPENGTLIRLEHETASVLGKVSSGQLTYEGGEIIAIDGDVMRDRRRMLWNGSVSVSVVLSLDGHLAHTPIVQQTGLAEGFKAEDYIAEASIRVEDAVLAMAANHRFDDQKLESNIFHAVRSLAKSMFQRRPLVQVHILRVDALAVVGSE